MFTPRRKSHSHPEEEEAATYLIEPDCESPSQVQHPVCSTRISANVLLTSVLVLGLACSWVGVVVGIISQEWIVLDKTEIGLRNLGEEHIFELKVGLFSIDYRHTSKVRQNQVGRIAVSASLDDMCLSSGRTKDTELVSVSSVGCDMMLGARHLALAAVKVIFACLSVVLILSLPFNSLVVMMMLGAVVVVAFSGLGILLACLARGAALNALESCVIKDTEAHSRLSGDASLSDLACSRTGLGSGSYVFILANALHGVVATSFFPRLLMSKVRSGGDGVANE